MSESQNTRGGRRLNEAPPGQPNTSNQDLGVGRGRRRGRGRGRVEQSATLEDALHQIRVERQITQRRIAALPTSARQELVARKREAHLERMLMPDASPRKRQTKRLSPERRPCIMVDQSAKQSVDSIEVEASTPVVPQSAECSSDSAEKAEAEPSTSGGARFFEFLPEAPRAEASTSRSSECCPVIIEYVDEAAPRELDRIGTPEADTVPNSPYSSPSRLLTANSLQVQATDLSDNDDDLDIDVDECLIPTVQERNAAAEPACDSDLTQLQAEVLRREDDANDRVVRDIATDDCYTFAWSNDRATFLGRRETFTGTSGPTFDVTDQTRAIDVFDKMIDIEFIDHLCVETNRNAEQQIALLREQNKLAPHSRFHRWTPTDRDEMVSFLAILILQGLYPLPEEEAYFSYNGFGTMPYFAKIMSYNRFLLLKAFLHFVDNRTCQDMTRLSKIRPVVDYFNAKFSSLYIPSQEIAIDESLLKWHGRLNFAQKISSKAAQVGVKTYELCESSSGYLWKFFVYAGKDKAADVQNPQTSHRPAGDEATRLTDDETNDRPDNEGPTNTFMTEDSGDRPTNATAKIVYDLIEPLLHRGHTVIMDNFYNSPLLLRTLKRQKTDCYGTLRLNREFVPDSIKTLTKTELRQGEVVATYCSDLAILVWRDANIVSMISTYHNLQIGTQDKYNKLTYKPSIVLDYNKSMGGVDRKDQFLSAQPMERVRNRIWYKKLFRRLYNAATFNCFVIFSSFHRKISHRQFRTVLAEDLLKRHRQIELTAESRRLNIRLNTTGQVTTTSIRRNTRHNRQARPRVESNHFPIRTGSKNTCCWMCPKKTRTIWKCEECDINLCIEGCFKAYHKP